MPTVLPYMSKPISPSSLKFHSLVRLAELLFWYYQLIIRHSDSFSHIFKRKFYPLHNLMAKVLRSVAVSRHGQHNAHRNHEKNDGEQYKLLSTITN